MHIGSNGVCPICHQAAEDIRHHLFECLHAKELWSQLGILDLVDEAKEVDRSGSVMMEHLLLLPPKPLSIKPLVVGCWYLWCIKRQHNEGPSPPMRWPMSILANANNHHLACSRSSEGKDHRWIRPEPKFVKRNVDEAFFVDEGVGATTAVLRDEKGIFLAAQCKYIPFAADVITTKAMAMCDGLNFANSLGFQRVEAESDSLNVIDYCTDQSRWWDAVVAFFAECVDVASSIGKVYFKHCFRSGNQAAHVLANLYYCNKGSLSWTDEPPGCLITKLVDDVMLV
jgi:ribonuclease HI